MNWLKQKMLLRKLFNKKTVFYYADKKWHFETQVENEKIIKLIKAFIEEVENENKNIWEYE